MKQLTAGLFLAVFAIVLGCSKTNDVSNLVTAPVIKIVNKKGICLVESGGIGLNQVNALQLGWYYDYGLTTNFSSDQEFVPMVFSLRTLATITNCRVVMGFNEPDNVNQSNMSVADAISNWSTITNNAVSVGSPATAGNPLTANSWLSGFMSQRPKVDFITVHWYKGCDANLFIADITAIIAAYNLPVWVTEFAPQTTAQSTSLPTKYTQDQMNTFINTTVAWMNSQPMVARFAWHDSKVGTSAIFTTQGDLTLTGQSYRDAK